MERPRLLEGGAQIGMIFFPTHSEVREVMEEEAENGLAVLSILGCVEDVLMPEEIDLAVGNDISIGIDPLQDEKIFVLPLYFVAELRTPTVPLLSILEFKLDHREVKGVDIRAKDGGH